MVLKKIIFNFNNVFNIVNIRKDKTLKLLNIKIMLNK
jgi:hypothetical protein